jgi:hypothetical protein
MKAYRDGTAHTDDDRRPLWNIALDLVANEVNSTALRGNIDGGGYRLTDESDPNSGGTDEMVDS